MTKKTEAQITYRVWNVGSNMPGYMPDEPPHPCESEDAARESIVWDILRDIDEKASGEWSHEIMSEMAELERFAEFCRNVTDVAECCGTIGNRHYFISEDTMTGEDLEECDCDPADYDPIIDEWIDVETLHALEAANHDIEILAAQYRYNPDRGDDGWSDVKGYDDGPWNGRWFVGSRECGPWIVPALLIRADSWESAYGIFLDESPTVPMDEVHDAYGVDDRDGFDRMVADARDGLCEWPDLSDEYSYQSNSSDSGIVYSADMHLNECGPENRQVRFRVKLAD